MREKYIQDLLRDKPMIKATKKKNPSKPPTKKTVVKKTPKEKANQPPLTKLKRKAPLQKINDSVVELNETNANILRLVSDNSKEGTSTKIIIKKLNRKPTDLINQFENKDKKDKSKEKDDINDEELAKEIAWRDEKVGQVFANARGRRGRPSKLTESLVVDMLVLARIGLSESAIANSVMIDESTLIKWKQKNKVFNNRLKNAREQGKAVLVNSIFGHGRKNWQSLAWILERMHREQFALNQKVELTGAAGGPITFNVKYEDKKEPESSIKPKKEASK